jgi:hypothetical protein
MAGSGRMGGFNPSAAYGNVMYPDGKGGFSQVPQNPKTGAKKKSVLSQLAGRKKGMGNIAGMPTTEGMNKRDYYNKYKNNPKKLEKWNANQPKMPDIGRTQGPESLGMGKAIRPKMGAATTGYYGKRPAPKKTAVGNTVPITAAERKWGPGGVPPKQKYGGGVAITAAEHKYGPGGKPPTTGGNYGASKIKSRAGVNRTPSRMQDIRARRIAEGGRSGMNVGGRVGARPTARAPIRPGTAATGRIAAAMKRAAPKPAAAPVVKPTAKKPTAAPRQPMNIRGLPGGTHSRSMAMRSPAAERAANISSVRNTGRGGR